MSDFTDRVFEQDAFDQEWIDRYLDQVQRAGKDNDERLERLADMQFRVTDQYLNGTIMSALERIEVLRRVPFPSAEG